MAHPWRLKELPPTRARDRLAATGTVILPAGTLVFRGSHLPLGCDTLILDRLADDLSARTGIPRAPTIEFGVQGSADETAPGAALLKRKTLHRVINELIASWEEGAGVRSVIILTAHAGDAHLEALSTVRAIGEVRVADILSLDLGELVERPGGPIHGGEVDTSLLLYLYPEFVRPPEAALHIGATAEKGQRLYDFILDRLTTWVQASQPETPETSSP
jgi:creatinine amidohydrolase